MLTGIVIAKNEQKMIGDCLKSLDFVDEIILVDTGSSDDTNKIAKSHNAKIVSSLDKDYSSWRNTGLKHSTGDWIIYLDADERVSPALRKEILQVILDKNAADAYDLPRNNVFLGKLMHHGGWAGDYVTRLFKKKSLVRYENPLHEQPVFTGKFVKLSQRLTHYSHRDLSSMLEKTIFFTGYESELRFQTHHPIVVSWRFVRVMFTEFWHRFIKLSAWRDGTEGVIDGIFQIFNTFIIYARLWEKQRS